MKKRFEVAVNHIAVEVEDMKKAEKFFKEVLGMKKAGVFEIAPDLSNKIFGIKKAAEVMTFTSGTAKIEVFASGGKPQPSFAHICIEVGDREELMKKCKRAGIISKIIDRNGGKLFFIRDFSENLFEIKQAEPR